MAMSLLSEQHGYPLGKPDPVQPFYLDLFCGEGLVAAGYKDAFDPVIPDMQPRNAQGWPLGVRKHYYPQGSSKVRPDKFCSQPLRMLGVDNDEKRIRHNPFPSFVGDALETTQAVMALYMTISSSWTRTGWKKPLQLRGAPPKELFNWVFNLVKAKNPVVIIHASPPCEYYSISTPPGMKYKYPALIDQTRGRLWQMWNFFREQGIPIVWTMENVEEAQPEIMRDLLLCGTQFGLTSQNEYGDIYLRRHRVFECDPITATMLLSPAPYALPTAFRRQSDWCGCDIMQRQEGWLVGGVYTGGNPTPFGRGGFVPRELAVKKELMGFEGKATVKGLAQGLPPVYGRFMGYQFRNSLYTQMRKVTRIRV